MSTSVRLSLADGGPAVDLDLRPGRNLVVGNTAFKRYFNDITSLELDLLHVMATIYAADVGTLRGQREEHTRAFEVELPVVNYHAFMRIAEDLEICLYLLTNDTWKLAFVATEGAPEDVHDWERQEGSTLLFSGGLDSLAKGVELAESNQGFVLVSHDSGNREISNAQHSLGAQVQRVAQVESTQMTFRVRGENRVDFAYPTTHEPSQRARSLLFASLGAMVARRSGKRNILFIAENGQMAIHLPLTAARIGSFSTHTAHPEVVALFSIIFTNVLGVDLVFENPYLYHTKGEVVRHICRHHPQMIKDSISCWKTSRIPGGSNHCGECVPCITRRVALESNGDTSTSWARDLFAVDPGSLGESDTGKRNLVELAEFASKFSGISDRQTLAFEFPELRNSSFSFDEAVSMYRRCAGEIKTVFNGYPTLTRLLS